MEITCQRFVGVDLKLSIAIIFVEMIQASYSFSLNFVYFITYRYSHVLSSNNSRRDECCTCSNVVAIQNLVITMNTSVINKSSAKKKKLLGYELTSHQNALVNHLAPSVAACALFQLAIACDIAVVFRHCKDGDPIWASLTLFVMYLPALGSYMIIISDVDCWPEPENGYTNENLKWFGVKTLEHLFFPVWNMWRFAERIFWSIEAARSRDEEEIAEAIGKATAARAIELYVFLQAYLHALPQVLLQLHILMRHNLDIAKESKDSQVACIVFNLIKVAVTTTYYQRFKAQKLTGTQYPWLKARKILRSSKVPLVREDEQVMLRHSGTSPFRSVMESRKRESSRISHIYNVEPSALKERRRSSDIYLEPQPVLERTNFDDDVTRRGETSEPGSVDEVDARQYTRQTADTQTQGPSLAAAAAAAVAPSVNLRLTGVSERSEPDFNIARVIYVKGLQEDDMAGKLIALLWWFTFLLGRVLAISVFAYFFMKACVWILVSHFLLVVAILLYDVKSDNVRRDKAVFFIFIGLVYIFCIIEFKIKFKKAYFIYYGYFALVFFENFLMCLIWYWGELDSIESDYWYRYTFYIIIACSFLSFSAMLFYLTLTKPQSVLIPTTKTGSSNPRQM